jgi:hypothetical protein
LASAGDAVITFVSPAQMISEPVNPTVNAGNEIVSTNVDPFAAIQPPVAITSTS